MANSSISVLKNLFQTFFSKMVKPDKGSKKFMNRFAGGIDRKAYDSAYTEWQNYVAKSKSVVLSYSSTVVSLVGTIGQEGVDAFNSWLATYATGSGEITSEGLTALKDWFNKYLKSLT